MASNSVSIEIGSHSVRAAIIINGKPKPIPLGFSSAPFSCPSVAVKTSADRFYFGDYAKYWIFHSPENFYHLCDIEDSSELSSSLYKSLFVFVLSQISNMGYEFPHLCTIITPAYYASADPRKSIIKCAAESAGLKNISFQSDAIAACMKGASLDVGETVMTFDFGYSGVTLSLIRRSNRGLELVKSIRNNTIGGRQIDGLLIEEMERGTSENIGNDILANLLYMSNLAICAEQIKEELTYVDECTQSIIQNEFSISREHFVEIIAPLLSSVMLSSCKEVINSAGLNYSDIKQVFLLGGCSNIPFVHESLNKYFIGNGCNSIRVINLASAPDYKYYACFGSAIYSSNSSSLIL